MIPLLHIEEVRGSTKDLAKLMQKHAFQGKKSTFPEDEQQRQKMCVRNLDVLATCVKEIKRGTHLLQSKIDALEKLYTSESSKALKKLMVKELEAYEEEISFSRTIGDAETFVFTLEDYMMECEIQLALMRNRKIFASLLRSKTKEQTLATDHSTKEEPDADSRSDFSANSRLYAQDKPQMISLEPAIPNLDDGYCATKIEAKNLAQSNSTEEKTKGRKKSNSSDDRCTEKVFSAHNEAPFQVMTPPVSSEVGTAVSKNEDLPASLSSKKIAPTGYFPEFNFILSCHIQFTNHIILIEVYSLHSFAFCRRHVRSYFADLNTAKTIRAGHQRPLLYPDKKKNLRSRLFDVFCHVLSPFSASCLAGGSVPIESAPLSPPLLITMKVMHKHDLL